MSPIRRIRRLRKRTEEANAKRQRRRVLLESLEPRLLLSGETLSFSATAGASVDLLLQLDDATQELQLIDKTDQTILKSKALANTTAVEITGADYDDKLTIDLSTPFSLSGGIKFTDAFSGDNDRLTIVGKDNVWNVTGQNAGNVDNAGIIEFLGIENLEGGSGNDVFNLDGGVVSGTIEGGGGNDTLHGPESDTTWNITGDNSGNVAGLDFSGIENLTGAADNEDTFVFQDGGSLSGVVEGGDGGFDSLVLKGTYDTIIFTPAGPDSGTVNLDGDLTTYAGLEPVNAGDATNVVFIGTAGEDDWVIEDSPIAGQIQVRSTSGAMETTSFNNPTTVTINLGTGNDILTIKSFGDSGFAGTLTINGGADTDKLIVARDANMTLTDTSLSVGSDTVTLSSIEQAELTGGDSANTLDASAFTGDVTLRGGGDDDILKGGTGDDTLEGGAGNDTFIFADSWGTDSVNSGGGKDLLDFTGFSGDLSLNGSNTFSSGTNQLSQTGTPAETIDVVLSTAEQTELVTNGLNALISMLERLEGYNQLAATLPLISQTPDSGTTGATFGEIVGISEIFSRLQSEFNSFFAGSSTDKLSELVDYLDTFSATVLGSEISSILNLGNVSLSTPTDSVSSTYRAGSGGALELLIDFNLEGTQSSTFDLNLGSEAEAVGVVFDATIDLVVTFDFDLVFGLEVDTGTPDFFVNSAQLELDVSAEINPLNASVNIGFLEAFISGGNIAMGGGLTVTLIDPTPADSRISVTDLGADLSTLVGITDVTTDHPTSTFISSLPLTINATGLDSAMQTALAGAEIVLSYPIGTDGIFSGQVPSIDQIESTSGVDLLDFSNITPSDVVGMLGQVMSALTSLGQSELLNVSVPFTDMTLGEILDYGTSFKRGILDPLFESGDALKPDFDGDGAADFTFNSVQDLATELSAALGITVEAAFETLDQELSYTFNWSETLTFGNAIVATTTPGGGGSDEVQTVTIPETAVDFRLGFEDEEGNINFTRRLTYDPNAEDEDAADELDAVLEALPGLNTHADNISVTRSGNVYTITFQENLANTNVTEFVSGVPLSFSESIGDLASIETRAIIDTLAEIDTTMTFGIDLSANSIVEITPAIYQPETGEVDVNTVVDGGTDLGSGNYSDEIVAVTVNALEGETFRLAFRQTQGTGNFELTNAIDVGASADTVQLALEKLAGIAGDGVTIDGTDIAVVKDANVYTITFKDTGALADTNVEIVSDDGILSGPATFDLTIINRGAPILSDGEFQFDPDGNLIREADTIVNTSPIMVTVNPDLSNASLADLAEDVQAAIDNALHSAGLTLGFSTIELTSSSSNVPAPYDSLLESDNDIRFSLSLTDADDVQTGSGSGKLLQRQLIGNSDISTVADALESALADALENINDARSRAGDAQISLDVGISGNKLTFTPTGLDPGETLSIELASIVTASAGGGRISLSAPTVSALPDPTDAYIPSQVVDRILRFDITDAVNNTAFTELGLLGTPTQLNGRINNNVEFTLVINGEDIVVTLAKADTDANSSIDDLVDDLQSAINTSLNLGTNPFTSGDVEVYRLNPNGNRIGLRNAESPSVPITTLAINVPGSAVDNGAISDLGFESGDSVTLRSMATEFFLQDVTLTGTATLDIPDISVAATIGFLDIEATGSGNISADAVLTLKNPLVAPTDPPTSPISVEGLEENRVTFEVLANALEDGKYFYDPSSTGGTVEDPATGVLEAALGGAVNFHLDVAPTGALAGIDGATATADIGLVVDDWLDTPPTAEDLLFEFAGTNWDDIIAPFSDLGFDDILGGLQQLLQILGSLSGSDGSSAIAEVLDTKLPLVDRSFSEIIDIAGDWAERIEGLIANPAGSIQELEILLRDIFDVPDSDPDILQFIPYDAGDEFNTGILNFDLDLGIGTELNRPFTLDLAEALEGGPLDFLNSFVSVTASGNLDVSADVNLALRMGLDLFGDDKAFFLKTGDDGTKLTANASASGNNLDFTAQVGPFAIFVIDGTAEISASVEVGLANFIDDTLSPYAGTGDRFNLVAYGDDGTLTSDLGDLVDFIVVDNLQKDGGIETDTVFVTGTGSVSLPLFIGTVDNPVPLDFLGSNPGNNNSLSASIDLVEALDGDSDYGIDVTLPTDLFDGLDKLEVPNLFALLSNPSIIVDGLDRLLLTLQEALNGQILGIELPFIGDLLQDNPVANFIEDFRGDFLQPLANTLRENNLNIEGLVGLVITQIDSIFTSLGLLESSASVELFDQAGDLMTPSGSTYSLVDYLAANALEFNFYIGDTITFATDDISFDVGLPMLGFQADLQPRITLEWGLDFGFGVDSEDGFYFVTGDDDVGEIDDDDLSFSLTVDFGSTTFDLSNNISEADLKKALEDLNGIDEVSITKTDAGANYEYLVTLSDPSEIDAADLMVVNGTGVTLEPTSGNTHTVTITVPKTTETFQLALPASATGRLAFLALSLRDGVDVTGDDVPDQFSRLFLKGGIDIIDPSGGGRLTFSEITTSSFSDIIKPSIHGGADLRIDAEVDFSTIDPSLSTILPSITTDIFLDWDIKAALGEPIEFNAPSVMLVDISLDLGSFISDFAGPILDVVGDILDPFAFLLAPDGFLNMRIPLLSDLLGTTITGKDLIEIFDPKHGPYVVAFLDFVEKLYFLVDLVDEAAGEGQVILNFGDLIISDTANIYLTEGGVPTTEFGFIDKKIDLGLGDMTKPGVNLEDLGQALEDAESQFDDAIQEGTEGNATSSFQAGVSGETNFSFPIFEPENIFKLLLGQPDISLVEIDLPELTFEFFYRQQIPIYYPLVATFAGGVSGGIDFNIGYDTRGLSQFLATDNPAYLINGFYLSDLDASGSDVREAYLNAEIAVGAALSLGLAKVGVEGGIEFSIDFNLSDLDGDGKVRLDEMAANIVANSYNPIAIFDVSGMIELFLRAYLEINLLLFTIEFEFEFLRLTLFEFDIPFKRPATLATQSGDVLTLNIGPNSDGRLQGNINDIGEEIHVKSKSDGSVVVWSNQFNMSEGVAGISPFVGVTKIVADGGAGSDVIDLSGLDAGFETEIHGGEGDDIITGSQGNDQLFGDAGSDTIHGGYGNDTIDGGSGDDYLYGYHKTAVFVGPDDDADTLIGGLGDDLLFGQKGNDRLIGGPGNDKLYGGTGEDTYDLLDFGSVEEIWAEGGDTLNFSDKLQNLTFFLTDTTMTVGFNQKADTVGFSIADFVNQVIVNNPQNVDEIIGSNFDDTFHVWGTADSIILDGQKGNDRYIFYTGTMDIDATIDDRTAVDDDDGSPSNPWNSEDIIEIVDQGNVAGVVLPSEGYIDDIITVTSSQISMGANQTIMYIPPSADENILQIKVKSGGGDDNITVESTAATVPVRVDSGSDDDTITIGHGTVDNIVGIVRPGLNYPFGLGPVVLVGGSGHDTVVIDDSSDTSDNIGNITAFMETRTGAVDDVEVGVVSGLDMTLNLEGSPIDGRVEFEGFEVVDVRMGSGEDTFTIGGGFDLVKSSATGGQADNTILVDTEFPKNRLAEDLTDSNSNGIKEFVHTFSGMTIVQGGGGEDDIRVLQTQVLAEQESTIATLFQALPDDDGIRGVQGEKVRLDIHANVGYFVLEFSDQDTDGDSIDNETVPGAEQTVVLPYDLTEAALEDALGALRLVGGTQFIQSVTDVGPFDGAKRSFEIVFSEQLGNLPDLLAFDTRLLVAGEGNDDTISVQSIDQPTYVLGGSVGQIENLFNDFDNDTLNVNVKIGINGTEPASAPAGFNEIPPAKADTNGVNSLLTVDGGVEGDKYFVYLFGDGANSQINLFDSGGTTDDSAIVFGTEARDMFLMRAAVANDGLAFVAMITPAITPVEFEGFDVERINYRDTLDSMKIFALGGDDAFGIDDTRIDMEIYGGEGEDFFQIGQLYKSPRNAAAGVPNADVFATIETTRGYLSNGISNAMKIFGGEDNDEFVVYHNLAPLVLNGDAGDDSFLIRAFALVGSQEDLRERTDVSGGAGADLVRYAVNAPVYIDGGDGFDTVIVIGTEFNDDFVITEDGIYGAGLNIQFVRVETVEVDGGPGDDRFFILGTSAGILTKLTGGLGSDTFFANGPTPDVVSNDLLGHSGLISHSVDSDDSNFSGIKVVGISANVADDDEPAVRITVSDGTSIVSQVWETITDSYTVVLTRKPENGAIVRVTSRAPAGVKFTNDIDGDGNPDPIDGLLGDGNDSITLAFNETNWNDPQTVYFHAFQEGSAQIQATATGGDGQNARQTLVLNGTEGSFKLTSTDLDIGTWTTDEITFDIRGDGKLDGYDADSLNREEELDQLALDIQTAINAKLADAGKTVTVELERARTTFFIEFLGTENVAYTIDGLSLTDAALTFNDIVGTSAGFINHDVTLEDSAGDDAISNLFVQGDVAAQRDGKVTVQVANDSIVDGGPEVQIFNFDASDGNFKISLGDQTSEEMLFIPLDPLKVMAAIDNALNAFDGVDATVTKLGATEDFIYQVTFNGTDGILVPTLEVEESNLTKGERTLDIVGALPGFITAQGNDVLRGATVKVVQGAGIGQTRLVIFNDEDSITVANPWILALDETSRIEILRYEGVVLPATLVEIVGDDGNAIDLRETGGETVVFEAHQVHGFGDGGSITVGDLDTDGLNLYDTVSVALTAAPSADVSVALDSNDAFENQQLFFAVETDLNEFTVVDTLAFSSSDAAPNAWNKAQTVYVFGYDDDLTEGFHKAVLSMTANDGGYVDVVNSVVVDIADNKVALAMVLESDGSTDVVETGNLFNDENVPLNDGDGDNAADDTYRIVLSKAPTADVTVNLSADPTRTQRGAGLLGIRAFDPEVALSDNTLVFGPGDWFTPQTVTVTAAADDKVEGMDSKSFATMFDQANSIEGPLVITGGISEDRSADLEREPIYLPGETNFKLSIGTVKATPEGVDPSYSLTIDLDEVIDGETIVDTRVQGGSAGVTTVSTNTNGDPVDNVQEIQVLTIDAVKGKFRLTVDSGMTADIIYNPANPAGVAAAIKSAINTMAPGTISDVTESGTTFRIKFSDTANHDPIEVELSANPAEFLTRVDVSVDSSVLNEQILTVFGNNGSFRLELSGGVSTAAIDFTPDDPAVVQAKVIEDALNALSNLEAVLGTGAQIRVSGAGSTYFITFEGATNPIPALLVALSQPADPKLRVDEVQTLTVNASDGQFQLTLDGLTGNTTAFMDYNVDAGELASKLALLDDIDEVTVRKDDTDPFYTIIITGSANNENVELLQVIEKSDEKLKRTVKEALETNLDITITTPEDLKGFTLEITRGEAKNKVRVVIGASDPDASPDSMLTTLEISRPWEAGLTEQVPSLAGESEFTLEKINPNLLVDENEETDFFFLNDTDNVTSIDEVPTAELNVTADRLTGLGMGGDQLVGGKLVEGGIRYTGLEELIINLGSGDNLINIEDTHPGATTINSGGGLDEFNVKNISGHTFLNAGADADVINVGNASLLSGVNALLTVTGDVPQAVALTLGKGSKPDPVANVGGVDEIQQITVDATGGTFKVGFIVDGDRYFTPALAYNVSDTELQDELQTVINDAFFDGVSGTDVSVIRGGNVYRITFTNRIGQQDVPLLEINDTVDSTDLLHVGLTMETGGAPGDVLNIDNSADMADTQAVLTQTSLTGLGMGDLGTPGTTFNEIQTIRLNAEAGTFTLGYMGEYTDPLAFDISAADLQDALEDLLKTALDLATEDNIRVTKNDDVYVLHFRGLLSNANVDQILVVGHDLTRTVEEPGGNILPAEPGSIEVNTRLHGITSAAQNEVQRLIITSTGATSGTFTIAFPDTDPENVTEALPFDITRARLQLALEALPAIAPGDVILTEVAGGLGPNQVAYDIEFTSELSSQDLPLLVIDDTLVVSGLVTSADVQDGLDTGLNDVQVVTINATAGTYQLQLYLPAVEKTLLTASLPYDADAEQVRRALQHELARELNGLADDADLSRTREAFKSDFSVARIYNTYIIGFQGVTREIDGGTGVTLVNVIGDGAFTASGDAEVLTRMDGINYYGFEQVNIDLGSGHDILNVQGTSQGSFALDLDTVHAATNISLADGDDNVYISSNADLDHNTINDGDVFEFLTGHLDDISGNLNLDVGEGRHRLLISDEAATVGDDNVRVSDNILTATGGDDFDDTSAAEIQIQGLAFGDITYGADPVSGDFYDGIIYWTGSGDDTITIDGTHVRDEAVERTTTQLNTGLGDDHVTVDLDEPEDGFFVLHTMGGAAAHTPVDPALSDGVEDPSDDDTVRAAESTLPLIIFGGLGNDDIIAGQNEDIVFGDFGRVQYLNGGGELIAVFGFGARDDMISSQVIDPTWVISRDLNLGGVDILEGQGDDDILIGGAGGSSIGDYIDGDADDDLIFGDAVQLQRRDTVVGVLGEGDYTNPRFQTLIDDHLYTRSDTDGVGGDDSGAVLVDGTWRDYRNPNGDEVAAWNEYLIVELYHSQSIEDGNVAGLETSFGNDYIAGGADHDVIFGQLGDDIIQGDGNIERAVGISDFSRFAQSLPLVGRASAERVFSGSTIELTPTLDAEQWLLEITPSFEASTDGDDYIEGNGGDDVIFGNLGQDDIVGDNSSLFTLNDYEERLPAGSDIIFGGAGTRIDHSYELDTDNAGDITLNERHARDADAIAGDNANIYRLVGINGTDGNGFLEFNYDQSYDFGEDNAEDRGNLRIIPRAVELLDYTLGGPDFDTASADSDIGAPDEIHGESGDDFIYGMVDKDILFGDSEDDDLIGGWGADWISGGTGQDGVLGDDGRIFTSRNSEDGEPLYGVEGFGSQEMGQYIYAPGKMQQSYINNEGELKKTVDLTPFNLTETGQPDDVYDEPQYANDIIYGGLGGDFLHGGAGDDAMSGAEALPEYFEAPINPGDVLRFELNRADEFADYDEYNALAKIDPFLLNFNENEGPDPYADSSGIHTDGNDVMFGDLGHDWMVGGTGRDHMYGGLGSDLLDADDDKETNGGLNDIPDGDGDGEWFYQDIAYGGAGRDVLIANTGGDRLIDWIGEFNSYLVPFAPFGMATVSRTVQPQLMDYLYDLSESDGADPTRIEDGGDPARNGEPWGELGLVLQKDPNWHDQTGAPDDPQAGNIPGGKRDVLRSADFNDGETITTYADSGVFEVKSGVLAVTAESIGGDAVALFDLDDYLPSYFEVAATITMEKPTGGWKANSYVIFDYQNENDFKFAGIDASRNKIQLGHHTADGWIIDAETPARIKPGNYYNVLVAVNGTIVTVVVDGTEYFSHTYEARVDAGGWVYGINAGMVGLGSDNSRGNFDNIAVQVLPPEYTFQATEDFDDDAGEVEFLTVPQSGDWLMADGRYDGTPVMSDPAVSLLDIGLTSGLAANSILEINMTANTDATTGIVFDYYGADDFKYAGLSADGNALLIGHFNSGKWIMDASFDFDVKSGKDYEMALSLKGSTVDVSLKAEGAKNWTAMVGYVFNAVTVDGRFGLLAKEGSASFDTVTVRTDDPFFKAESQNLLAAAAPETAVQVSALINEDLALIVDEAIERWSESGMVDGDALALLDDTSIQIIDLPETTLGMAEDNTILIDSDAAGYGWFIDQTPGEDEEFGLQNSDYELGAAESSLAYGQMDLLSVVIHEIGHLLGFENLDPDTDNLMSETLEAGTRKIPAYVSSVEDDSPSLISMDTETDSMAAETITGESVQTDSSWVTGFLMDSANKGKSNPFEPKNKFEIRLNDDEEESALI